MQAPEACPPVSFCFAKNIAEPAVEQKHNGWALKWGAIRQNYQEICCIFGTPYDE
jgi:hypothetical protein